MFLLSSYRHVEHYNSASLTSLQTRFRSAVTYRQCFSYLPTGSLCRNIACFSHLHCRRVETYDSVFLISLQTRFRSAVTYRQCFSYLPTGTICTRTLHDSVFLTFCRRVETYDSVFLISLQTRFRSAVTYRQCFSYLPTGTLKIAIVFFSPLCRRGLEVL